jgi:hypothetical protein
MRMVQHLLSSYSDQFCVLKSFICEWTGAPGFIMDSLLTGIEFVKGWQRELFVAKWSMHQLV